MDELEILKKDWQKNQKFPKLSKKEIYRLLHKNRDKSKSKNFISGKLKKKVLFSNLHFI